MTPKDLTAPLASDFPIADPAVWRALVEKSLKGADFDKRLVTRTADGLRIEPLYTRAHAIPAAQVAHPGTAPFTRGSVANSAATGWQIRQFHGDSDPTSLNAAVLEDLDGGATSLALQIAGPGVAGLELTQGALARALDGVLLDICPVALIAGETAAPAARALIAIWDSQGIDPKRRIGHFGADPLGHLAQSGRLGTPLEQLLDGAFGLASDVADAPGVTALIADGHPYHAAGASEAQELAAMLATLVAYLRAAEARGLSIRQILPKIAIGLAADADQFATIAKLRAARRLVWRVAEASGAGEAAGHVHLSSATAWRMMARRDPWTNMLRTSMACAAAAMGGADAICVLPYTFALGKPDRFARRIARNTHLVLAEESGLGRIVDPTGGSWYVEKLTDDLAREAWSQFQEIEGEGGMVAALGSGLVQDRIAAVANARQRAIATGRMELTGVSAFPLLGDDGVAASPWPQAPIIPRGPAAHSVRPLTMQRLAAPFEALRDAADEIRARHGQPPTVFLASIGEIADHTLRSTWVKNYLAAGGIDSIASDGYADGEAAARAFAASGVTAACICSSDDRYATHAEPVARALKAAGARIVLMAGRPGERETALRAAGVDQFLSAGQDAVAVLGALQAQLSPPA